MALGATIGDGRRDHIQYVRELLAGLSSFCRSVEEIAILESDVQHSQHAGHGVASPGTGFADPKAHLLSLTELVQQTLEVVGELLAEIETPGMTGGD